MTRMSHDEQRARACRISVWGDAVMGPVILTQNNPNHQHIARINEAKNPHLGFGAVFPIFRVFRVLLG